MTQKSLPIHVRSTLIPAAMVAFVVIAGWLPAAWAQDNDSLQPLTTTQPAVAPASNTNTTAAPPPATAPRTITGGDPEPRREPDPTAVLRELTSKENAANRVVVLPNRPTQNRTTVLAPEAIPQNAIKPVSNRLLPDGYRLVDRTGRLTREGDYYVFSFESRSEQEAEAPMRLLPNRLLEDMEDFSEGGTRPVVFVVSGEVTEYHGVNYLLLQKLLTRPNLGNLK